AVQTLPLSIAAQFLSLIPVFGVGGAYVFLGERLTLLQGLGIAIVVAAVAGIARIRQENSHDSTN
ncbi:MAG: EamA family transporter, partial [Elainella sp.]